MVDADRIIHELAAPQHGVFSRTQARRLGVTRQHIARRVTRGVLHAYSDEVLAVTGAAATTHQGAIAAVLDAGPGAALSHRSCAAYWQFSGYEMRPFHVSRERGRRVHPSELAVVHTTTCLPDSHITEVDGLAVTVPARVIFDLAGSLHPDRLARLVDAAWRRRLVTGRLLRRTLGELAEQGRPGIQAMREICETRGDDYRPTESNLEARFQQLMHEMGLRTLVRQVDLGGCDWIGRVDFLEPGLRLVIEIDGEGYHASLTDQADDLARRVRLEHEGFTVLRIRQFDVWHRPDLVKSQVRAAIRRARTNL